MRIAGVTEAKADFMRLLTPEVAWDRDVPQEHVGAVDAPRLYGHRVYVGEVMSLTHIYRWTGSRWELEP